MKRKTIDLTYDNILLDAEFNILRWYDFSEDADCLAIGWNTPMTRKFCEECKFICLEATPDEVMREDFVTEHRETMDYVILMETIEVTSTPAELIGKAYECLKSDGTLLIITNNRYAIKHFCGEKTPYEERLFEELEGKNTVNGCHCYGSQYEFPGRVCQPRRPYPCPAAEP